MFSALTSTTAQRLCLLSARQHSVIKRLNKHAHSHVCNSSAGHSEGAYILLFTKLTGDNTIRIS